MLTLTRYEGESIYLYPAEDLDPSMTISEFFAQHDIVITLTRVCTRRQVRLSIEAPPSLTIAREELS